jgi:hypothetical protein
MIAIAYRVPSATCASAADDKLPRIRLRTRGTVAK